MNLLAGWVSKCSAANIVPLDLPRCLSSTALGENTYYYKYNHLKLAYYVGRTELRIYNLQNDKNRKEKTVTIDLSIRCCKVSRRCRTIVLQYFMQRQYANLQSSLRGARLLTVHLGRNEGPAEISCKCCRE